MSAQPVGEGGLRNYAAVLARPQIKPLFAAAFVGRLPVGMYSLAIVLLLSKETGSFAVAGAAIGAFAVFGGASAPILGRLIDRIGQTPVLVSCAIGFPVTIAALIAVAHGGAETVPVLACAGANGLAFPPLFTTMRALISVVAGSLAETAFALEAIIQELFFVVGPLLVALIVAIATAEAALAAAAALAVAGTLAFSWTPASRHWRSGLSDGDAWGALASPGILTVILLSIVDGLVFGTLEVALPAFGRDHGSAGAAGLMLGTLAFGSMLGGLWYGARSWSRDPAELILIFAWPIALGLAPLALANSIPVMIALLFVAGLFIAPSAAVSFSLVSRLAPEGTVTEAFSWLSAAVTAGFAAGGALGGILVEQASVDAALLATAGFALLAAGVLYLRRATLRGSPGATAGAASIPRPQTQRQSR
jgi:MFS family permease